MCLRAAPSSHTHTHRIDELLCYTVVYSHKPRNVRSRVLITLARVLTFLTLSCVCVCVQQLSVTYCRGRYWEEGLGSNQIKWGDVENNIKFWGFFFSFFFFFAVVFLHTQRLGFVFSRCAGSDPAAAFDAIRQGHWSHVMPELCLSDGLSRSLLRSLPPP